MIALALERWNLHLRIALNILRRSGACRAALVTTACLSMRLSNTATEVMMLPLAWLILTRLAFPVRRTAIAGAEAEIAIELKACGPMTSQEKGVAAMLGVELGG